jgi:hypothetical protein
MPDHIRTTPSVCNLGLWRSDGSSAKNETPLQQPDRRSFLLSLASLGLTATTGLSEKQAEPVYRFSDAGM